MNYTVTFRNQEEVEHDFYVFGANSEKAAWDMAESGRRKYLTPEEQKEIGVVIAVTEGYKNGN